MKVLIIDDDPKVRQIARSALQASGYAWRKASTEEAGVTAERDGGAYEVLVLDCAIGRPVIQTITLNGFHVMASSTSRSDVVDEHEFRVEHFRSATTTFVTVTIDPEAVARIERLTGRALAPGGAFFRLQAERLLAAHVWSEGRPPESGRLTVRDVSRDDIDIALAWQSD